MKKLLLILLILSVPMSTYAESFLDMQIKETEKNARYNTAQRYKGASYEQFNLDEICKKQAQLIKDPGLYQLSKYNEISDSDYKKKLAADELIYKNKMEKIFKVKNKSASEGVDYYRVYRICERIIRANNLDYINWRIAIRKTHNVNAASADANYVEINTGLYDSLGDNDDALAFVLAHEIAHQILGHTGRSSDMALLEKEYKQKYRAASRSSSTAGSALIYEGLLKDLYREARYMEYMADSEGLSLLIKAGYSPENAFDALRLLANLDGKYTNAYSTHPSGIERVNSFKKEYLVIDPNWVFVGRENLYNSDVLRCKKSSDRVSFVISKSKNPPKIYQPETVEQKLTRMAYVAYLKGALENAQIYFAKLAKIKKTDYVPYLYISYANEVNYKVLKDKKWLRKSNKAIKKAAKLAPTSPYVIEQMENVRKLKEQAKNKEYVNL